MESVSGLAGVIGFVEWRQVVQVDTHELEGSWWSPPQLPGPVATKARHVPAGAGVHTAVDSDLKSILQASLDFPSKGHSLWGKRGCCSAGNAPTHTPLPGLT